jgi:chromosome segregation ATPase
MKLKKNLIVVCIAAFALLTATMLTGCGQEEEKTDFKALLKETAQYVADIEQQNNSLEKKLAAFEDAEAKAAEGEGTPEERVTQLTAMNQMLTEEKDSLEKEVAFLKSAQGEDGSQLTNELDRLKKTNKELAAKNAQMETELKSLGNTADEAKEMVSDIEKLRSKNLKMIEQKGVLEKEIATLRSSEGKASELSDEVEKLKLKNEKLSEQKGVFEKEIAELRATAKENERLKKEIEAQKAEFASLEEQSAKMKSRLAEIQKMISSEFSSKN